jgi:SNF2 family DNA or RNA helicase
MIFTPRPYQRQMIDAIVAEPRVGVWAGMGLGKTSACLAAIDTLKILGPVKPLVLAPLRVAQSTWPDETRKWSNLSHIKVQPIVGSTRQRERALAADADVYAINYENIPWLCEAVNGAWPFDMVIADESTRLKSFRLGQGGKRARALGKVAWSKVKRFVELTGTPSPNGLADLWGQAWFLDRGERLGKTYGAFTDRWFMSIDVGGFFIVKPRAFADDQIQEALSDICFSLDPKDWFDLKDPIVNHIEVTLPPAAMKIHEDFKEEALAEIAGKDVDAVTAAAVTTKCLQVANGAVYIDDEKNWNEVHDAKLDALASVVEEAAGAPILVAYHWKHDLARLLAKFKYARVLDKDPQTIRDWNAGKIRMLLAHPASAGHGLNLQDGGNILVFFGLWWNLEEHQQIIERIGPTRQAQSGHDRPVYIHYLIARGTFDELVLQRLEGKRAVQDILMEAVKR